MMNTMRVKGHSIITEIATCFIILLSFICTPGRSDVIDAFQFETIEQEAQFFRLSNELRCPQCQNQTIGDSNAPIAQDLRREVYRMIVEERADDQTIISYMLARYGDFVLYKPQFNATTAVLWLGPLVLLLGCLFILFRLLGAHRIGAVESTELDEQEKDALKKILNGKEQ